MEVPFVFQSDALKGKVAFVTGGASGIGLGIATRLAMAGADIVLASRRDELCEEHARRLAAEHGVRGKGLNVNVRDSESVKTALALAFDSMGGIDILVNNAAGNFYYPSDRMSDNQWKAVMEIDLYGTFYGCREAFNYLKMRGGCIINVSMTLHHQGWVGMLPACSAKAGIDALTMTLAHEWGHHGIRVNAIAPGPIVTEGVQKAFGLGGDFSDMGKHIPMGRTGDPEDIGNLAVFLASPAACWMTGSIVVMDGGERLATQRPGVDPTVIQQLGDMLDAARKK